MLKDMCITQPLKAQSWYLQKYRLHLQKLFLIKWRQVKAMHALLVGKICTWCWAENKGKIFPHHTAWNGKIVWKTHPLRLYQTHTMCRFCLTNRPVQVTNTSWAQQEIISTPVAVNKSPHDLLIRYCYRTQQYPFGWASHPDMVVWITQIYSIEKMLEPRMLSLNAYTRKGNYDIRKRPAEIVQTLECRCWLWRHYWWVWPASYASPAEWLPSWPRLQKQ